MGKKTPELTEVEKGELLRDLSRLSAPKTTDPKWRLVHVRNHNNRRTRDGSSHCIVATKSVASGDGHIDHRVEGDSTPYQGVARLKLDGVEYFAVTVEGDSTPYQGVARLKLDGVEYFAVTEYYDGVFPANVVLRFVAATTEKTDLEIMTATALEAVEIAEKLAGYARHGVDTSDEEKRLVDLKFIAGGRS